MRQDAEPGNLLHHTDGSLYLIVAVNKREGTSDWKDAFQERVMLFGGILGKQGFRTVTARDWETRDRKNWTVERLIPINDHRATYG